MKKKKKKLIILIIVLVILIYIMPRFVSTSRYVYNVIYEHYLASKDFYFTSDKLTTNHTEYEVTNNWSGAESYTIPVTMSSKKNDMAFTEADIEYTITCSSSSNISATLSKTSGTIVGTDNSGSNTDYFNVVIEPAGGTALPNGASAWVEVVATATSPYHHTISGKLIVEVGAEDITYEIIDSANSPYLIVNITNTTSSTANVTLTYDPDDVLLDMTSTFYSQSTGNTTEQINSYTYLNSISGNVGSLSVTSVKFYKQDPSQNYSYSSGDNIVPIIGLN